MALKVTKTYPREVDMDEAGRVEEAHTILRIHEARQGSSHVGVPIPAWFLLVVFFQTSSTWGVNLAMVSKIPVKEGEGRKDC